MSDLSTLARQTSRLLRRRGFVLTIGTLFGLSLGITITVGTLNLNATLKLIEKINIGPFSGMVLNASSGSCVTIINGPGNQTTVTCASPSAQVTTAQVAVETASLVQNGGFERGFEGWGTGFYESLFRPRVALLLFGGAVANWEPDKFAYKGQRALRVQHKSEEANHVFSSLSQQ